MMSYREFVVPDDETVLEVLGVPARIGEEVAVRTVRLADPEAMEGAVELTYDVPGRSIRCRWMRGGAVVMEVFREGATVLSVSNGGGSTVIEVRFETESLVGVFRIAVSPRVSICDELLLR